MPALASNAIITVEELKEFLEIDTNEVKKDNQLRRIINAISTAMEAKTGHIFVQKTITDEYHDGRGTKNVWTDYKPIISVTSLYDDTDRDFGSDTLIDSDDYVVYPGHIELDDDTFDTGQKNIKITYEAGYAAVPEDVKLAVTMWAANEFLKSDKDRFMIMSQSTAEDSVSYSRDQIPPYVQEIIDLYRGRI